MSDAVPSIFPWTGLRNKKIMDTGNSSLKDGNHASTSREQETESIDAIKKFIEAQEKELQEQKENIESSIESPSISHSHVVPSCNVMDMMFNDPEIEIDRKNALKSKIISPDKANGSMALSVGSKVEAKDFGEEWYSAEIIEVDYDEMEVLVHYENEAKKHDEWISVSSPRLRPAGSAPVKPGPSSVESVSSDTLSASSTSMAPFKEEVKEVKQEEKAKLTFAVGERCLARWRDNRRFVATVRNDLGNGSYEIIFDDGCQWTCKTSRLYKLRPGKDDSSNSPAVSNLEYGAGPSNVNSQGNTYSAYHTHLFDPTRDYLGSKSERREKKRKLNIKEIFNIGQKRPKTQKIEKEKMPVQKRPRIIRRKPLKLKQQPEVKIEVKPDTPAVNAVASIIGTFNEETTPVQVETPKQENKQEETSTLTIEIEEELAEMADVKNDHQPDDDKKAEADGATVVPDTVVNENDKVELDDLKPYLDPEVLEEEVKLEQFEKPDEGKHEEVIDRIKEVINKLEDGLNKVEQISSPKPEPKSETPKPELAEIQPEIVTPIPSGSNENITPDPVAGPSLVREKKKLSKIKKGKKLRMLREKKVKKQVEKVKSELEEMKKQVEEMRQQMLRSKEMVKEEIPAVYMLPTEWCCKWVNGQPVGKVSEIECELKQDASGKMPLPRRSVQVEDKRLPDDWTKHMVRRSLGNSAGKWDVVLVSPDNRRFHTKNEMRLYLESHPELHEYEHALTDFGVHLKLARRMGWISHTPDGLVEGPDNQMTAGTLSCTSPLVKRKNLSLKKKGLKVKGAVPKVTIKMKPVAAVRSEEDPVPSTSAQCAEEAIPTVENKVEPTDAPPLEDGNVYVGSLKVEVIENLLRCPAVGCFKNFRNTTLLKMHIKHYHRELRKKLGVTPKVLDLAYARTMPLESETPRTKDDQKVVKVKLPRLPKPKVEKEEPKIEIKVDKTDDPAEAPPSTPVREGEVTIPRSQDSPKLRQALINKPVKRPRVLLPVRRLEPEEVVADSIKEDLEFDMTEPQEPVIDIPSLEPLDFETAISTHTVTKPLLEKKRKSDKKKKMFLFPTRGPMSEEEDWFAASSDVDTRSSFPRSGTPDSKVDIKAALASSESNEDNKDNMYTYNECGERIKIVHMKREEIINCHCGFREEDGLMVQCELCLCWQHALCHNIQRETDVPEKYTCSICLNPRRGRRSQRFVHDQERLYEGTLPGAKPCESLRRSHELAGNLLRITDALHALRVKYYVATKKDHPKLYLWAKDWDHAEIQYTQEKLNSDYSDLNIMISTIGKENLPVKPDDVKDLSLDIRTLPSDDNEHDRFSQRDIPLGSQSLLGGLLSSPGGASLDLPISTSELERLAKSVQEQESQRVSITAPQPEAAIENSACRERLLKHLHRCQVLIDARLDSIEAQVAELESQDPSFEDDETADYFPRTKQTIQMLMRDLDTMEELGVIT